MIDKKILIDFWKNRNFREGPSFEVEEYYFLTANWQFIFIFGNVQDCTILLYL